MKGRVDAGGKGWRDEGVRGCGAGGRERGREEEVRRGREEEMGRGGRDGNEKMKR